MAIVASVLGVNCSKITGISLGAAGVATIAHLLGFAPDFVTTTTRSFTAGYTLQGGLAVITYDATYVVVQNSGGLGLVGEALAMRMHSIIR